MNINYAIIFAVWVFSLILLFLIRRDKRRIAVIAFFFKQWITCILGHVVVQLHLLSYPVRELADISRTSITYEFMAYPSVCAVFTSYYPSDKPRWMQFGYYVLFCSPLTILEVLLERYTEVIRYERWNWFWTWSTLFLTFLLTRVFCAFYFQSLKEKYAEPSGASGADT
jgi:hypothetical protein